MLALVGCCKAQTISAVLNAASYSPALAPGTWAAIFGSNLAGSTVSAQSVPLPAQLGNVSVTVGGIAAPLLFISPGQVNALIPFELPAITGSSTVTVPLVLTNGGTSVTQQITLRRNAPGIFSLNSSGTGNAIVLDGNFQLVNAVGTDPIVLYATGLGPVTTPVSSAAGASGADKITDFLTVNIGYRDATIQYAGLAPGFPGIYQINLIPDSPLTNTLSATANGVQSSALTVPMNLGANISNASGSITPLYPTSNSAAATTTELPVVASFAVDLQIKANANPFDITAVSVLPSGIATIHVDPTKGTWQATTSVPSAPARQGDFSGMSTPVYDLLTCQQNASGIQCSPFPGNIVPTSRLDPAGVNALGQLPQPTVLAAPNGTYTASGSLPSNGHLVISSSQMSDVSIFGIFQQLGPVVVPSGSSEVDTFQFQLFADGLQLDSKSVSAQIQ